MKSFTFPAAAKHWQTASDFALPGRNLQATGEADAAR